MGLGVGQRVGYVHSVSDHLLSLAHNSWFFGQEVKLGISNGWSTTIRHTG